MKKSDFRNSAFKDVKQLIEVDDIAVVLYDYDLEDPVYPESNICAFNKDKNLIWTAENCPNGRYWEMQFDEDSHLIEASDGGGMLYDIELRQGRIVSERFVK